jgi:hypothetical protein
MDIERDALIAKLGGEDAVRAMDHEARADAIEDFMSETLDEALAARNAKACPTVTEIEERIETRDFRRGVGKLFRATPKRLGFDDELMGVSVQRLPPRCRRHRRWPTSSGCGSAPRGISCRVPRSPSAAATRRR